MLITLQSEKQHDDLHNHHFSDITHYIYYEALLRAQLPDVLAELDRADLIAVYRAARLLAIAPRGDDLFTHQKRQSALARGGCDRRDAGLAPQALGGGWPLDLPRAPPARSDAQIAAAAGDGETGRQAASFRTSGDR